MSLGASNISRAAEPAAWQSGGPIILMNPNWTKSISHMYVSIHYDPVYHWLVMQAHVWIRADQLCISLIIRKVCTIFWCSYL